MKDLSFQLLAYRRTSFQVHGRQAPIQTPLDTCAHLQHDRSPQGSSDLLNDSTAPHRNDVLHARPGDKLDPRHDTCQSPHPDHRSPNHSSDRQSHTDHVCAILLNGRRPFRPLRH